MELGRDAEIQVLAILRRRKYWDKYKTVIQPGFFGDENTKHVFTLYQKYYKRYHLASRIPIVDLKILIRKYTKNTNRVNEALLLARKIRRTKLSEPKFIEETITEFAQRQTIKIIVMEGLNILESPEFNTIKLRDYFQQIELIKGSIQQEYISLFQNNLPTELSVERKRWPTGISDLDEFLRGGYEGGELLVILAPPERGKTMALINFGFAVLNLGGTVFHFTHEIAPDKVVHRYHLRISGMSVEEMKMFPDQLRKKLNSIQKRGGDLIIKDFCDRDASVDDIQASLTNFVAQYRKRPDVILIDYADLVSSGKSLQERFELKETYKSLRRMAQAFDIPIVTASQSTRKSATKLIISMEDFAEAYSKAHIADMVVALCQTPEEQEDGMMRIHLAKNRRRPGHPTFRINTDADRMAMWSPKKKEEKDDE